MPRAVTSLLLLTVVVNTCAVTEAQDFSDDLYRMELTTVPEVADPGDTAQLRCRRTSSLAQSDSLGGFGQSNSLGGLAPTAVEWVLNSRSFLSTAIVNRSCVVANRDSLGFQTVDPAQLFRFRCQDDGILVTLFVRNVTSFDDATAWQCKQWPLGESDVTVVRVSGPSMRTVTVGQLLLTPSGTALVRKGGELRVECRALSASPPPSLVWLQQRPPPLLDLALQPQGKSRTTFDLSGSLATTSILYFRPKMSDEGTSILCRALNDEGGIVMTSSAAIVTIIVPTTTTTTTTVTPSSTIAVTAATQSKGDNSTVPKLLDMGEKRTDNSTSNQTGVVVGIVVCVVILLIVAAVALALFIRRRRGQYKSRNGGTDRPRVSVGIGGYMMPDGSAPPRPGMPIEHHIYTYVSPNDHAPSHVTTPTAMTEIASPVGTPNGFCNGAYGVEHSYLRLSSPDPRAGRHLPPIPSESPDVYDTLPPLPNYVITSEQDIGKTGSGTRGDAQYENVADSRSGCVDHEGYEVPALASLKSSKTSACDGSSDAERNAKRMDANVTEDADVGKDADRVKMDKADAEPEDVQSEGEREGRQVRETNDDRYAGEPYDTYLSTSVKPKRDSERSQSEIMSTDL